jgi:hypothetical protein
MRGLRHKARRLQGVLAGRRRLQNGAAALQSLGGEVLRERGADVAIAIAQLRRTPGSDAFSIFVLSD